MKARSRRRVRPSSSPPNLTTLLPLTHKNFPNLLIGKGNNSDSFSFFRPFLSCPLHFT
ncbi:unnamed protein product [Musa acuminata subsp. burmannicoides]